MNLIEELFAFVSGYALEEWCGHTPSVGAR
jgi:hypothetical protein